MSLQLFPDDPNFSSTNWVPINKDSAVWDTEITAKVKKAVPIDNVDISIVWNTQEKNKGYGLGSAVIVSKRGKKKFIIPIILKDFKMAPLDVMITSSKAMPLSEDAASEALFSGAIGDMSSRNSSRGLIEADPNGFMPNDFSDYTRAEVTYQKSSGIDLAEAIANGNWDVLRNVHPRAQHLLTDYVYAWDDKEGLKRAAVALQDMGVMNKFAEGDKSIFVEFMDDISTDQIVKEKKYGSKGLAMPPLSENELIKPGRKIEVVKKMGPDAYVMMSNSIANFDPAMNLQDGPNVRTILTSQLRNEGVVDTVISALEAAGTSGVVIPWPKDDDDVTLGTKENASGSEFGIYDAFDESNSPARGVLFTRVMDLDGNVRSRKVFITPEGGGKQEGGFTPKRVPMTEPTLYNEDYLNVSDAPGAPDSGYMVLKDLLIGPLDIMSVSKTEYGGDAWVANVAGEDGSVKVLSTSKYIQGVTTSKNAIRISDRFKWVSVPRVKKYRAKSALDKKASLHHDRGRYHIQGLDVPDKWSVNLKEAEAKFTLSTHGMGIDKIASAMDGAKRYGSIEIYGIKGVERIEKSASSQWEDRAWNAFSQHFDHNRHNFVKLASMFDRLDTVDKVLGLNFISKANIARFVSALPLLKDALEELVRLLVVSRIGATEVPEEAISQTIDSMGEVIDGLETLSLHGEDEDSA
jgi:hypothetical protein